MFPNDFYSYLNQHSHTEIKGGTTRDSFLEIWMVEVDQRIFARSWNKSARSWFTEFQNTGVGEIKYGTHILKVSGMKVPADDPIQPRISAAYIARFTEPENLKYAEGIAQPDYFDYTLELKMA